MRRIFPVLSLIALTCVQPTVSSMGQSNLPIGLPADQMVPLRLDGYRLVKLDRTKEVVFEIDNKKVTVEVPLFIYLPERDQASEMRAGLDAVHSQLARLSSQKNPIDPAQILTIFLALDRTMNQGQLPVSPTTEMAQPVASVPPGDKMRPTASGDVNPLEEAIKANKR